MRWSEGGPRACGTAAMGEDGDLVPEREMKVSSVLRGWQVGGLGLWYSGVGSGREEGDRPLRGCEAP